MKYPAVGILCGIYSSLKIIVDNSINIALKRQMENGTNDFTTHKLTSFLVLNALLLNKMKILFPSFQDEGGEWCYTLNFIIFVYSYSSIPYYEFTTVCQVIINVLYLYHVISTKNLRANRHFISKDF